METQEYFYNCKTAATGMIYKGRIVEWPSFKRWVFSTVKYTVGSRLDEKTVLPEKLLKPSGTAIIFRKILISF